MNARYDIAQITADFLRSQKAAALKALAEEWDCAIQNVEGGVLTSTPTAPPVSDTAAVALTSHDDDEPLDTDSEVASISESDDDDQEEDLDSFDDRYTSRSKKSVALRRDLVLQFFNENGGYASRGEIIDALSSYGISNRQVEHILRLLGEAGEAVLIKNADPRENRWRLADREGPESADEGESIPPSHALHRWHVESRLFGG